MVTVSTLEFELSGRFQAIAEEVGKRHLSVRWEPAPRIARVGAMLEHYDWDNRMRAIQVLRAFERDHADEFALEYDVLPLEAVTDESYAEA